MLPNQPNLLNQMRRRAALQGDMAQRAQIDPTGMMGGGQAAVMNAPEYRAELTGDQATLLNQALQRNRTAEVPDSPFYASAGGGGNAINPEYFTARGLPVPDQSQAPQLLAQMREQAMSNPADIAARQRAVSGADQYRNPTEGAAQGGRNMAAAPVASGYDNSGFMAGPGPRVAQQGMITQGGDMQMNLSPEQQQALQQRAQNRTANWGLQDGMGAAQPQILPAMRQVADDRQRRQQMAQSQRISQPQPAQQGGGETPLLSRIGQPQSTQAAPMQNDRARYVRPAAAPASAPAPSTAPAPAQQGSMQQQNQQFAQAQQRQPAPAQQQQQAPAQPQPTTQASYWNNVMSQPQQAKPQQPAYSTQSGMPERTQEQRDQQDRDNAASDSRSAAPQPQYRQHDFGGSDPKGGGFQKMADGGVIQGIQDFLFGSGVLRKLAGEGEGLRGTILGGYSAPGKQDYRQTKKYVDDTKQVKEMRGKQEADKKKKK